MKKRITLFKFDNAGTSLVELIVVISILAALAAGSALGISLAFSRDASQCATKLNDMIYRTRMDSMSKTGNFYLEIKLDNGNYKAQLVNDSGVVYEEWLSEKGRISSISAELNGTAYSISGTDTVKISFDKSKGNVRSFNGTDITADGASGTLTDGVILFLVTSRRGNKTDQVTLVTSTGKHKAGVR